MDPVIAVVAAIVLAGFGARLIYSARAEPRSRLLQTYSRQVGLALVTDVVPELSKRLSRRERSVIFGAIAGLSAGVIAVVGMDGTRSPWNGLFLAVALVVGGTVSLLGNDSGAAFASVADEPRFERAVTPKLADYVTPLDRAFSLGLLTFATVSYIAVLGIIALNPARAFDEVSVQSILWPAGLLLALATLATLVTWAAADTLLSRGQPASTIVELAWSDAFRGTTLRSLVAIPGLIAAVSTSVLFQSLSFALRQPTPGSVGELLAGAFPLMGPVILITLILWAMASRRHRNTTHYLRRLWPDAIEELGRSLPVVDPAEEGLPGGDHRTKMSA